MNIVEIKSERHYDYKSINRHSTRTYEWKGCRFYLDRTLDGCPPFFHLYRFEHGKPLAVSFMNNGQEFWGEGWNWKQAEKEMVKLLLSDWNLK